MELVALKAAIGQIGQDYAFSERRACGLMTMAVSSYRYPTRRNDEPLRTRLVELAREKPRFGYRRLHVFLVNLGLYPDEAHAMVQTWHDSRFEEGSRLIYIVPRRFIDSVLPLTIDPAPGQIVRVFVGRLEIVTPATAMAVKTAVAHSDEATLDKYGRFLEPILQTIGQAH